MGRAPGFSPRRGGFSTYEVPRRDVPMRMGRTIVSAVVFLMVSAGVAFAQYNYGSPTTPQPAPAPSQPVKPATGYTVNVATATVPGKRERILTDAKGMALYYFTPDTPTKAACTGGCA